MRIMINGQHHDEDGPLSVGGLLDAMALDRRRVAVELNRQIVRRANYDATMLADADEMEIVTLVGGG